MRRRGRFDPQPLRLYLARRDREIAQALRSGFLLSPGGLRTIVRSYGVETIGELECEGGIRIDVEEHLQKRRSWVSRTDAVQLGYYRYNARLSGRSRGVGLIFRYNSPHEDHNHFHHVHRYDTLGTGEEILPPREMRPDEVPTLREILAEAERWHYDHPDRS